MIKRLSTKLVPLAMALAAAGEVIAVSGSSLVSAATTEDTAPSTQTKTAAETTPVKIDADLPEGVVAYAEAAGGVTFSAAQSAEAQSRVKLMLKVTPSIKFNDQGLMESTLSDADLAAKYDLDDSQLSIIHTAITNYNRGYNDATSPFQYKAKFKGGNLYLSYGEIVGIISVVNDLGPIALATAISGVASVVPGVGTIIGGAIGLLGSGTIILAMTKAITQKKGIRIGLDGIAAVKY